MLSLSTHHFQVQALRCYRDDRLLFGDVSFQLANGELLLVEGANGSGKTTLLRMLCGLRQTDDGHLSWCGFPLEHSDYFSAMAYMGHHDGHKKELTVLNNLRFHSALHATQQTDYSAVLAKVGLTGYDDTPVQQLSAGQKRRLALARVLLQQAVLWILDEPFTALDKHGIALLEALLSQHLNQGGMVIMTSHQSLSLRDWPVQRLLLR